MPPRLGRGHLPLSFAWSLGLALAGCSERVVLDTATESTADSTGAGTGGSTTATSTATTSTSDTPPTTSDTCADGCASDLPAPGCDFFAQDCPAGQKCSSDGDAPLCAPIDPNPGKPGDPCAVHSPGVDSCALGGYCWVDEICHPLCKGPADKPTCPEGQICVAADGGVPICTLACDPLLQDCPEGQVCVIPSTGIPACGPDVSGAGGEAGDVCQFINGCDPGNQCDQKGSVPNCGGDHCCTPFCDTTAPEPGCPPGQACVAFYEPGTAPVGLETLGTCGAG